MQISKILNNNVVITEKDQAEVVAMGRGLAFGKKIGDQIAVDKIEKFYTLKGDESSRVDELLAGIPDDIFLIIDKVITLAKEKIPGKINDSLFLSLADHINATQLRAQEGFVIKNFLLWDIKRFFPTEFSIGKKAVADISDKFDLPHLLETDDEAGFIAMHIVNSELGRGESSASELTKLMEEMLTIVKYSLKVAINEEDIFFQRFVTHLKFFSERVLLDDNKSLSKSDDRLFEMIIERFPESYETTSKIVNFLDKTRGYQVSKDEQTYITIHLARILPQNS